MTRLSLLDVVKPTAETLLVQTGYGQRSFVLDGANLQILEAFMDSVEKLVDATDAKHREAIRAKLPDSYKTMKSTILTAMDDGRANSCAGIVDGKVVALGVNTVLTYFSSMSLEELYEEFVAAPAKVAQVVLSVDALVDSNEGCDRCGAVAKWRVVFASGFDLVFCDHHTKEHQDKLKTLTRA